MAEGEIITVTLKDGKTKRYRARIDMGLDPVTGKRKRSMMTFRTKKEAQEAIAKARVARETGTAVDHSKQTVRDYLVGWLDGMRPPGVKLTTHRMYTYHIHKYVLPELDAMPLQKLTPALLKASFGAAARPNVGRVSHRLLHSAFKEAVNLGLLAANPLDRVAAPRTPKPKRGSWDVEQAARFLEAAGGDGYAPLWTLALYTGLRSGELLGLRHTRPR